MENDNDTTIDNPTNNEGKPWPLIFVIVLLTLVAVWLVPEKEDEAEPLPDMGTAPVTRAEQASEPSPSKPQTAEEGTLARKYIASLQNQTNGPDKAFQKAIQLQDGAKLADAYLLFFYAARNGHMDAAMTLAKQADPAFFNSGSSILEKADPEQANKWYRVAEQAGSSEAKQLLADLHKFVSDEAAAGSEEASRLMLQWK